MTASFNGFLDRFPEFETADLLKVETLIEQVVIETCGYVGLPENLQNQAIYLNVAHYLECDRLRSHAQAPGQQVKKFKSKHDELEFFATGNQSDPFDLSTTSYGKRLRQLLDSTFVLGNL